MFPHHRRVIALVVVLVLAAPAAAVSASETLPALPVQLELGDSWTYGDTASDPAATGYAGIVFERNRSDFDCVPAASDKAVDGCRNLQRVTLARPGTPGNPGVTTDLFIVEQQAPALELLERRNGDANPRNNVEVILITLGGNDVFRPVLAVCLGGLTDECTDVMKERLAHVASNLDTILAELRAAAGPDTEIVITTYDNPIAYCPLGAVPGAVQLGSIALEGYAGASITGLNNVIRDAAAAYDITVAETFGRLGAGQWTGDCLHPADAGYAEIAEIVGEAINS